MWFDVMLQVNFNVSMLGFIWKKYVTNFLHDIIFKSNMPLSSYKKLFSYNSYHYLPINFKNSFKLLLTSKNHIDMKSVELYISKKYIKWFHIILS